MEFWTFDREKKPKFKLLPLNFEGKTKQKEKQLSSGTEMKSVLYRRVSSARIQQEKKKDGVHTRKPLLTVRRMSSSVDKTERLAEMIRKSNSLCYPPKKSIK